MLTKFQKEKLCYLFQLLDLNRNGLLEANDFSDMVESVRSMVDLDLQGKEHKQMADKAMRLFHRLIADISPSRQQAINEAEWLNYFEDRLTDDNDALDEYQELIFRYMFDFFDHNNDGFITKNEYEIFFEIFGADRSFLNRSFDFLDKNGDGKISRYEILAAIEDFLISDNPAAAGNWIFGNWEMAPKKLSPHLEGS